MPALPILLMLTIAAVHQGLIRNTALSPWRGGGFAMFSTMDGPNARFVRAFASTSTGLTPLDVDQRYQSDVMQLRVMPTSTGTISLAERMAGDPRVRQQIPLAQCPCSIVVEVWVINFVRAGNVASPDLAYRAQAWR